MAQNQMTLEDQLYQFRSTMTDRVRRNVAVQMRGQLNSSSLYRDAFPYYAMLRNTDASGSLTLRQIDEIAQNHSRLLEERSAWKRGVAAVRSFLGIGVSSLDVSRTLETLTDVHRHTSLLNSSLNKRIRDNQKIQNPSATDTSRTAYYTSVLQKAKSDTALRLLSGRASSLSAYALAELGYVPHYSAPLSSTTSIASSLSPLSSLPQYSYRPFALATSLSALAAACIAYVVPSSTASPPSHSSSYGETVSVPCISLSLPSTSQLAPSSLETIASQSPTASKQESVVYGYSSNPTQFQVPKDAAQRELVIASIDSWNGNSLKLEGPTATSLGDGIYKVDKRSGYADFLFVQDGRNVGTASYRLGQPKYMQNS